MPVKESSGIHSMFLENHKKFESKSGRINKSFQRENYNVYSHYYNDYKLMNGENSNTTQNLGALQLKFLQEQNLMLVTFVREYFIEKT